MEDKNMKTAGRLEGWHRNTDFAVNLKTILRSAPNFRPLAVGADFSVARYALGVYNEICLALCGLVGEE